MKPARGVARDFEALYWRTLSPSLAAMEPERKALRLKIAICFVVIFGAVAALGIGSEAGLMGTLQFSLIGCIPFFFLTGRLGRQFRMRFKSEIIEKVFTAFFEDCVFQAENHISEGDFQASELFADYNQYAGEDYLAGIFRGKRFEFSELKVLHETGSGKNRKVQQIFNGVFFQTTAARDLGATVLIRPDQAEKIFGQLVGRFLQKNVNRGSYPLVELESQEFEQFFTVRSNSQQKARILLSPAVMQRLVSFRRKYGKQEVAVSVKGQTLRLALSSRQNWFEPKIFGEAVRKRDFDEMIELFTLIEELLTALDSMEI